MEPFGIDHAQDGALAIAPASPRGGHRLTSAAGTEPVTQCSWGRVLRRGHRRGTGRVGKGDRGDRQGTVEGEKVWVSELWDGGQYLYPLSSASGGQECLHCLDDVCIVWMV